MAKDSTAIVPARVEQRILSIRGQQVIIDADLADLYGVSTKRLNEQVKRNSERFPDDFVFRLTDEEKSELVANCGHLAKLKFAKSRPSAFTEHGAVMAAGVLNSQQAKQKRAKAK
ncbi:MAG: ORF6N domain-containing protein [Planctomycetes bacterium]|nr:ORF6N domain-containing protein [Planctomycetota bacterium]